MRAFWIVTTVLLSAHAGAKCVPAAEWSGKIIPPSVAERRSDGSIRMELENTPEEFRSLKGKVVRLVQTGPLADLRYDVTFGPKAQYWTKKDELIVASGLDGWKNVSPLESLAHSRPNDVIRASLKNVSVSPEGNVLSIDNEPVLLDGNKRCLVQFLNVEGDKALVRHHDGKTETMRLDFKRALPISADQKIHLLGIAKNPVNQTGWDIFGHEENGEFVIESIEPYALHKVLPGPGDGARAEKFKGLKDYWRLDESMKGQANQITYLSKRRTCLTGLQGRRQVPPRPHVRKLQRSRNDAREIPWPFRYRDRGN